MHSLVICPLLDKSVESEKGKASVSTYLIKHHLIVAVTKTKHYYNPGQTQSHEKLIVLYILLPFLN